MLDDESEYFLYDQLAGETPPQAHEVVLNRLSGKAILDAMLTFPELP